MIRDSRQPVEAHFHVVSDFRRDIYDDSLSHPPPIDRLTGSQTHAIVFKVRTKE